ncbi:MAG: hypothetical protein ACREF1_12680 [Acetobacteraceae bacterium]
MPALIAGCTPQPTTPAATTAAVAAPAPPPRPDPMMQARADVATLENAIATRNTADAMASLDSIQSEVPNVGMGAEAQGRIMAGITQTRRDVSNGAWASAAREVTVTRSALYAGGGGGGR